MIDDTRQETATPQHVEHDWRLSYARRLAATDLLVLIWVVFGVQLFWFGFDAANVTFRGNLNDVAVSYSLLSSVLVATWTLMLNIYGTRGYRIVGTGSTEYKLIANASLRLFGLVAIVAFLFHVDFARGYILLAFPIGLVVLMLSRWMWRQWLNVHRAHGRYSSRVLLVGSLASMEHLALQLGRQPAAGYWVVGACTASGDGVGVLSGTSIPIYGNVTDLQGALGSSGADTVIITSSDDLPPNRVRELSWGLELGRQHLIVAPSLTDIGGPRIHTRPVAGLPLIHVETPRYEGRALFAKRAFDIVGSTVLLVLSAPFFAVLAILVKFTSPGPVFFKQERVGYKGRHFVMLKFRSMKVNADSDLAMLLAEQGTDDTPLFKVQNDPRITSVGRRLRKYSLDEFPQLLNVFRGDMSLVGPRPQRDGEVALYDDAARRRLLLKPGMSGLWQVSGRSSLSWEDAIRLDLYYVENWSMTGDFVILWRTFRAVLSPGNEAL
ncbi:MAG: sugar transferase [Microbacteriaceae bacterium]|nr:MAG: sugar transferase [Microbacteriaceae bacterium]